MSWLHASGGLLYHWRAWRHRAALWAPFHAQVATWLMAWRPDARQLVLIGPSGGYALPAAFLARFARVSAIEPDPLAHAILRVRFPHIAFAFDRRPHIAQADGFNWLAQAYPGAALLFCNLLGQRLEGQGEGFDRLAWLNALPTALCEHDWASWHDLASTGRQPDKPGILHLPRTVPLEALVGHFWRGGEIELNDHECHGIAPDLPREYAIWPLRPGRFHLVEWLAGAARRA